MKYLVRLFESLETQHSPTEEMANDAINKLAAEGWRIQQIATSPGYGEGGLAHASDFSHSVSLTILFYKEEFSTNEQKGKTQ